MTTNSDPDKNMAPTDGKLAMSASPTLSTSDNFETRDIRGMVVSAHACNQAIPNYSTSTAIPSAPLRIGAGHCGSVWTVADASWVIKRADGSKHRSLWKEHYLRNRILSHLNKSTATSYKSIVPVCGSRKELEKAFSKNFDTRHRR